MSLPVIPENLQHRHGRRRGHSHHSSESKRNHKTREPHHGSTSTTTQQQNEEGYTRAQVAGSFIKMFPHIPRHTLYCIIDFAIDWKSDVKDYIKQYNAHIPTSIYERFRRRWAKSRSSNTKSIENAILNLFDREGHLHCWWWPDGKSKEHLLTTRTFFLRYTSEKSFERNRRPFTITCKHGDDEVANYLIKLTNSNQWSSSCLKRTEFNSIPELLNAFSRAFQCRPLVSTICRLTRISPGNVEELTNFTCYQHVNESDDTTPSSPSQPCVETLASYSYDTYHDEIITKYEYKQLEAKAHQRLQSLSSVSLKDLTIGVRSDSSGTVGPSYLIRFGLGDADDEPEGGGVGLESQDAGNSKRSSTSSTSSCASGASGVGSPGSSSGIGGRRNGGRGSLFIINTDTRVSGQVKTRGRRQLNSNSRLSSPNTELFAFEDDTEQWEQVTLIISNNPDKALIITLIIILMGVWYRRRSWRRESESESERSVWSSWVSSEGCRRGRRLIGSDGMTKYCQVCT